MNELSVYHFSITKIKKISLLLVIVSLGFIFCSRTDNRILSAHEDTKINSPIKKAVLNAGNWIVMYPESGPEFDAAIGMYFISKLIDNSNFQQAFVIAKGRADRDFYNPFRLF